MEAAFQGPEIKTGFNQNYLRNVLKAIVGELVKVSFNVTDLPWRFEAVENPDAVYLIMQSKID